MSDAAAPDPAVPAPGGDDLRARIEALRARGADRADPIGFHFIEVLHRRAAGCDGDVRRLLEARLATLIDGAAGRGGPAAAVPRTVQRGPLADLVDDMARRSPAPWREGSAGSATTSGPTTAGHAVAGRAAVADAATLRYFRRTWSRLSIDHQLNQSLAKGPDNAGPLNSHRLVLRALERMRQLSPGYLDRFVSQVDALLWLDQAVGSGAPAPTAPTRAQADKRRKPIRRKGG